MGGNLSAGCLGVHGPVGFHAVVFLTDTRDVEMKPFHFSPFSQRANP